MMNTKNDRHYITVPVNLRDEMKQLARSNGVSMQKVAAAYVRQILANPWQPKFNDGITQVIADLNPDEATRLRERASKVNVTTAAYIRAHYEREGLSVNLNKDEQ